MIASVNIVVLVIFAMGIFIQAELSDFMYQTIYKQAFLRYRLRPTIRPTIRQFAIGLCTDPSNEELQILLDYKLPSAVLSTNFTRFFDMDKSGCDNRKFSSLANMAICPYKLITSVKSHRYPRVVVQAKCTCDFCRGLDGKKMLGEDWRLAYCEPVYEKVDVLFRDKCGVNNIFHWKKVSEFVPKYCDCRQPEALLNSTSITMV
jgi:hypothetical protein